MKINPFLPHMTFDGPLEMKIGPDGAIYMIEYAGWRTATANTRLIRLDYVGGANGQPPVIKVSSTPDSGPAPLTVQFSTAGTTDPEGGPITYAWDFTSNGSTDLAAANPSFTYSSAGSYTARLTVKDVDGMSSSVNVPIVVGNTRPVVNITTPPDGGFMEWQGTLSYQISVSDAEDGSTAAGTIDCSRVKLQPAIGHADHAHPQGIISGCGGTLAIPDSLHEDVDHVYLLLDASYTDEGASPLSANKLITLQPKRKQAEHFDGSFGVAIASASDIAGGGKELTGIDNGDWISFAPVNFQNMTGVRYRVAGATGGTIELRLDSPTGALLSTVSVPAGTAYADVGGTLAASSGPHTLSAVFKGSGANLFRLNWIDFIGGGASTPGPTPTRTSTSGPTVTRTHTAPIGATATRTSTTPPGTCGTANAALNKTATSSAIQGTQAASRAVDGNAGTRWESAHGVDPGWIQVDLGAPQSICRVRLQWEGAYARAYQLQVSNDAATWTNLYSTTAGDGGVDTIAIAATARYVRMYGTQRATQYGYSIWELEVYLGGQAPPTATATRTSTAIGTPPTATSVPPTATRTSTATASAGCGTTNLALNKPATSSAVQGTQAASRAVDGNAGTRWESAHGVDPGWIRIDLGATTNVCRVSISWEGAYATAYQIQVSNDGTTWTTIRSLTAQNGGVDDHTGLAGSGRYLRIYGTQRATQYGYSIWELQIYGG